jgi:hypothetical protein
LPKGHNADADCGEMLLVSCWWVTGNQEENSKLTAGMLQVCCCVFHPFVVAPLQFMCGLHIPGLLGVCCKCKNWRHDADGWLVGCSNSLVDFKQVDQVGASRLFRAVWQPHCFVLQFYWCVAHLLLCVTGGLQSGCSSYGVSNMLLCVVWFLYSSIAGVWQA